MYIAYPFYLLCKALITFVVKETDSLRVFFKSMFTLLLLLCGVSQVRGPCRRRDFTPARPGRLWSRSHRNPIQTFSVTWNPSLRSLTRYCCSVLAMWQCLHGMWHANSSSMKCISVQLTSCVHHRSVFAWVLHSYVSMADYHLT